MTIGSIKLERRGKGIITNVGYLEQKKRRQRRIKGVEVWYGVKKRGVSILNNEKFNEVKWKRTLVITRSYFHLNP